MIPTPANPNPELNGAANHMSVADELKKEAERLHELANQLKAREQELARMEANYPHFKAFVMAKLKEVFDLSPLPGDDLEAIAAADGALPLEAFFDELGLVSEES